MGAAGAISQCLLVTFVGDLDSDLTVPALKMVLVGAC